MAGNGRKEHTRKGGTWAVRLGSEAQLGTSIATFSADGAGSFILRESPCENNAEGVPGPEPVAGGQQSALTSLSRALLHHASVSNTDPRPLLSGKCRLHTQSYVWVESCTWLCQRGQGGNGDSMEVGTRELSFLTPLLSFRLWIPNCLLTD